MEEKKFVSFKKEEFKIREYIKNSLGKGGISFVTIEYTPVGEKIKVFTSRPGIVIGKRGEKIEELTNFLKKKFSLENPHIEICEIREPLLDARLVADEIAMMLERKGSLKFKVIAYKILQQIIKSGALGAEIVLSGKLPSERARSWRFAEGYLKKTGDPAKIVDRAQAQAVTIPGVVGIQVSILKPDAKLLDQINVDNEMKEKIRANSSLAENKIEKKENEEVKKMKKYKKEK
ncbi:30S ribosomal protein S3 [Candidatus Pacearchaeota archaeon]|nr:30S ribosomal protein S3 [Candidatus Pacearchaeota archaeon]